MRLGHQLGCASSCSISAVWGTQLKGESLVKVKQHSVLSIVSRRAALSLRMQNKITNVNKKQLTPSWIFLGSEYSLGSGEVNSEI